MSLKARLPLLKSTLRQHVYFLLVSTIAISTVWLLFVLGDVYRFAWWDDAWKTVSSFFSGAGEKILETIYDTLDQLKSYAQQGVNDVWTWLLYALFFTPYDIYFFALGILLGLLTTNSQLLNSLGVLLTLRRIAGGWLSGAEWAAIGVAIGLELIPLGEDITMLPIVWMILCARTTLFLALGNYFGSFLRGTFGTGRGIFSIIIKIAGWIGLFLALLDILGFGMLNLIPWARTFFGVGVP